MALLNRDKTKNWLDRFPWRLLRLGSSGSGHAFGVLSVWVWWERFTNWRYNVHPVGPDSFLLYSVSHYSGEDRTLADGTHLRRGDELIEIHFNNPFITKLIAQNQFTPWKGLRLAAHDVHILEERILAGTLGQAKAIHAITLFAATGNRLGFEVHRMPHTPYWGLVRYFMIGLIALYHPDGWAHASKMRSSMWPGEMWLGIQSIRHRAAAASEAGDQKKEPS